ncbi:type II secretion system secretin GspD [Thioalkalivibrio sp. XN8]|uniref:type II secretion system secretin GspD n=1 Tax=Thioalkalivibrio sp. XN8 TaxID=2712863 RepID=UPI0013EB1F64|nr:type II secretion system secretin GspD [Thioalkalivibrio sp. XN8]NGP54812.1 type II secretion system secretin GspD [Thioalkalivibrio sp. XN8]
MINSRPPRGAGRRLAALAGALALALAATVAPAQEPTITPNYKEADLRQIIEAVSAITGRNFIVDPRVRAQVTLLSSQPMSPDAFYEAFLSILEVHGYVAAPAGDLIKILPDANARQVPGRESAAGAPGGADEIVTQVITVRNVGAAQLVPILRPLIPQYGHLAAHQASNMLIISDRAANVNRLLRIIQRIDTGADAEIEVIPLEHASASDVVRVVTALQQAASGGETGKPLGLVADDRTNSVLISGDGTARLRMRALISHLDTPLEDGGNTQVVYLRYADAEDLAQRLRDQASAAAMTTAGGEGAGQPGAPSRAREDAVIWADPGTNALVITAPAEVMRSLRMVIDKLDIRRAQVMVEAFIAEVAYNRAAQLGVTWAIDGSNDNSIIGLTKLGTGGIVDIAGAALGGDAAIGQAVANLPQGILLAGGRIDSESGTNWAVALQALLSDSDTNVLSNTSIVTMDNEEAEIKIGQEVPFVTGQFTNTGAAQGSVNPFQTVERKDVGLTLKVTPKINEGDAVVMNVSIETSNIAGTAGGAVDLITNQRTITQRVLIEDGDLLVLGGLVSDDLIQSEQKVPLLGDIPLLGQLFRSQSATTEKRTLMIFLRPVILRDGVQSSMETNAKYRLMQDAQSEAAGRNTQFLNRNVPPPVIPDIEDLRPASEGYEPPPPEPEDRERASERPD